MAAMSNFLENKLIDHVLRGQVYTAPTSVFLALFTAAPDDTGGGTEVTGGSYARAEVACSLAAWAGTQSAGSTVASSGTSGTTSNNASAAFPAPTANWGSITHFGIFDAVSGGNLLIHGALTAPKTVNNGDAAPAFNAGALQFQIDN